MEYQKSKNDNLDYTKGRPLNEAEVKERLKNTPKTDVDELFKRGFRKLEDIYRDIENGFIQP